MKLWIDDVRPMPSDFDLWAKTADEAVRMLIDKDITHISFDHDLGERWKGDDTNTGYYVATMIESWAFQKARCGDFMYDTLTEYTWDIHSQNPIGAKRIEQAMTNAQKYWNEIKENKEC